MWWWLERIFDVQVVIPGDAVVAMENVWCSGYVKISGDGSFGNRRAWCSGYVIPGDDVALEIRELGVPIFFRFPRRIGGGGEIA